ncbi:hypothetical protein R1sor_007536 [Riccia sorocarpa]|uniref:RING-type E3 ubiquitin transferase n=1 Tax=Riccia sorocarpa TaxID=122646 RepID=A0ABD3HQQ9_9MARC
MERYNTGRDGYNGVEAAPHQWHSSYNNNSTNSRSSGSIREEADEVGSISGVDSSAVRNMITVMGGFAMSALLDADGRSSLKERCAERLKQEHGVIAPYAEQAVLANLDWGIQGLEKAVKATNNPETRSARLEHTEEMLQVAVNLDPRRTTGGVPNSYLSSWANYYMALVWKLRNNDRNTAVRFLEMFILEPGQSRRVFAPALWEQLFRPHMANIDAWYQAEHAQIMSSSPPLGLHGGLDIPQRRRNRLGDLDGSHLRTSSKSLEQEFDDSASLAGESINGDMTPSRQGRGKESTLAADQIMRLELLNRLYQDSLDENTQQYAQYYKDWMAYEAENMMQGSVQGSPVSSIMRSPLSYSSQEADQQQQTPRQHTSNGASGYGPGGAGSNQYRGKIHRHPSMDRESDTFSEASYKDPSAFSRNSSINQSIQEVDEASYKERRTERSIRGSGSNSRQDFDDGAVLSGDEDDCSSTSEFGRGAGVFLDGEEELTEDELVQLWEELSDGRITSADAHDFISRLTDQNGQPVTYERLSELAEAATTSSRENRGPPEQLDILPTLDAAVSATNFEAAVPVNSPHRNFAASPLSSIEDEEPGPLSRQGSVIAQSPFPVALRRMQSDSSHSTLSSQSSRSLSSKHETLSREQSMIKPPKDYVCSMTKQLFLDPVCLETGHSYERTAIKEWLDRGNKTCPNTGKMLRNLELPQTNFVLKRLVDTWKEDHPQYFQEFSRASSAKESTADKLDTPLSPIVYQNGADAASDESEQQPSSARGGRRIVPLPEDQVTPNLEETLVELKGAVDTLFKTDDLGQCEKAVRVAARAWVESKGDASVASSFSKSGVVEKLVEVLKRSKKDDVLRSVVFLLSDLISKDASTRDTVMNIDRALEATVAALKNPGVPQSAVLLHLLKAPSSQLEGYKLVPSLLAVLKTVPTYGEETFLMPLSPKSAAVSILEQLVTNADHRVNMKNAEAIVAADGVRYLMERLEAKSLEEKISAVAVMWSCLQSDGGIRTVMAQNLKIKTLVDLLNNSNEQARTVAIFFLAELIRLNRRPAIQKILEEVLRQGQLNSMHVLMAHLKVSPFEHRALVASLLLQMDLLAEPHEPSMFREEALEALVNALGCEENNKVQLEAAKVLASLSGRFSITGRSMTEAYLLKYAGINVEDHSRSRGNVLTAEEEKAADEWDKRMAVAVLGNGKSLIDAVGTVLPSKSSKIARLCLVTAAWITCALRNMPESGLQVCARNCFLPSLVAILQPGREMEEKVLACLCLFNLTDDSVGLQQLTIFAKDLFAPLRRLRRVTWTAKKIVTALIASPYMNNDLWAHGMVNQLDAAANGETRCLLYFRGHLYSGHADHSIKVWGMKRKTPRMIYETKEHSRAVLCFAVLEESQKLFSGSADKTVRVWTLSEDRLKCLQVIDIKEAVHAIAVNTSTIVVIPQNAGVKVLDANGSNPRVVNGNKHVQSINLTENHLYCGCTDSSIQEIDPGTGISVSLQSGVSSLRGKKAIYSLQSSSGLLYSAGTLVEGIGTKMWSLATRAMIHFISTQMDVRCMAMSDDLIYLSNKEVTGTVEVWLRDKYQKVAGFSVGSKILSLAVVGDTLYTASVDGIIRAWSLT